MMRAPNGSLARTRPHKEHGRHIFAYCNVTTNQVLYSLTQVLQGNRSLKQLPDAGANNNPPKLRKDLWRPLWSVTLPDGENGLAQGLHTFKQLREYRKQHEMSWEPPPELARPTTQEEMDEIQKQLDERGGKKSENVHDVIKQRKKKIRQRMVMDQKANSIADLAAILVRQDAVGVKTAESKQTLQEEERDKEVAEMLRLAEEANNGGLEKIDAELKSVRSKRQAKKEGESNKELSNRGMARQMMALEKQRRRMLFAARAVAAANEGTTWLSSEEMTAQAADEALRQKLLFLRQQIQERRDAETSSATGEQLSNESESGQTIAGAQTGADLEQPEQNQAELTRDAQADFTLSRREIVLELEMIRRLHARPERVTKALEAYTAHEADISTLRSVAEHWASMFRKVLKRSQERLTYLQELQAAVESGKDALAEFQARRTQSPGIQGGELDVAKFQQRSPSRKLRIKALEERMPFLEALVQMTSGVHGVNETVRRIRNFQSTYPEDKYPEVILKPFERGQGSQLKVLGHKRAFATVLAKAKVDAHAARLAQDLERSMTADNTAEEPIEGNKEAEMTMDEDVSVGAEAEQQAEPTQEELREAVKHVRRLSKRLDDVDNISLYEAAVEELKRGEHPDREPRSEWGYLEAGEKLEKYEEYLSNLMLQVPTLAQARQMIMQSDGIERLSNAAEAARERSLAAREKGEEGSMMQQKQAARVYETVANLRMYEDVILSAPESALEEPAQEEDTVTANETAAAIEPQSETSTETQERGTEAGVEAKAPEPGQVDYHALLPSFPERTSLPKKGPIRNKLLELRKPIYTAAGVTVRWNNMLDAEYAESWPQDVQHEPMGLSRHTAPKSNEEPIFDVAEYKNQPDGGYKGKKWERLMEKKAIRERVKGVTERVLEAVVKRREEERVVKKAVKDRKKAERAKVGEFGDVVGGEGKATEV